MADTSRPSKRQKTSNHGGGGGHHGKRNGPNKARYRAHAAASASGGGKHQYSNISASGLQSGDVGVFVTSDMGCEKRALREAEDLLAEIIGNGNYGLGDEKEDGGDGGSKEDANETKGKDVNGAVELLDSSADLPSNAAQDIEKDILAELSEMRGSQGSHTARSGNNGPASSSGLGLVTLDIPCVSFVRLPILTKEDSEAIANLDPVELVYRICRQAHAEPSRQRSRYIKRLTPLSRIRKVMNGGVEKLCEEVLSSFFGIEQGRIWKYAVRVSVRNNQQVSKDEIIKTVAGYVVDLGKGGVRGEDGGNNGNTSSEDEKDMKKDAKPSEEIQQMHTEESEASKETDPNVNAEGSATIKQPPPTLLEHKVDLKGFDKLILVEVYRNVVGMSVVGGAKEFDIDLKKFNLSEIYAEGRKKMADVMD